MHLVRIALVSALVFSCTHAANPVSEPVLSVLERGDGARAPLRIEPAIANPIRVRISMTAKIVSDADTAVVPTVRVIAVLEATQRLASGGAIVRMHVESADVGESDVDMRDISGTWHMAPTGRLSELKVEGKARLDLQEAWVQFPDEPIGIGARWRVSSRTAIGDVTWDRIATYRLVALEETVATVEVDTSLRAGPQVISPLSEQRLRLTKGGGTVHARLSVPLRGLVAMGTSQSVTDTHYQVVGDNLLLERSVHSEIDYTVEPGD